MSHIVAAVQKQLISLRPILCQNVM